MSKSFPRIHDQRVGIKLSESIIEMMRFNKKMVFYTLGVGKGGSEKGSGVFLTLSLLAGKFL